MDYEWKPGVLYSLWLGMNSPIHVKVVLQKLKQVILDVNKLTFKEVSLFDENGTSLPAYGTMIWVFGTLKTRSLIVNFDLGAYNDLKWGQIRGVFVLNVKKPYNKWPETILGTHVRRIGTLQRNSVTPEYPVDLVAVAEMIRANNDISAIPEPTRAGFLMRKQRHILTMFDKAVKQGFSCLKKVGFPNEICLKILSSLRYRDWIDACPLEETPAWAHIIVENYRFLKKTQQECTYARGCVNLAEQALRKCMDQVAEARKRLRDTEEFEVAQKKMLKFVCNEGV